MAVFPSGKKSFIVRYRFGGIKRKLTLGGIGLAAARKVAAAALYEVHEGRDPAVAKKTTKAKAATAKADTVQWVCEQYLKREGGKLRSAGDRKRALERLVYPVIGSVPLATLRRCHIVALLDKIQGKSGDRMADITLAYLRKSPELARGQGGRFQLSDRQGHGPLQQQRAGKITHARR